MHSNSPVAGSSPNDSTDAKLLDNKACFQPTLPLHLAESPDSTADKPKPLTQTQIEQLTSIYQTKIKALEQENHLLKQQQSIGAWNSLTAKFCHKKYIKAAKKIDGLVQGLQGYHLKQEELSELVTQLQRKCFGYETGDLAARIQLLETELVTVHTKHTRLKKKYKGLQRMLHNFQS